MNKHKGMTLVELMITLMIIATVLSLAIITLRGYIPKQRLISSVGYIENLAQQAQTEANARSYWTCIAFTGVDPITAKIWVDVSGDHGGAGACGNTGDVPLTATTLKSGITFASPGGTQCSNLNTTGNCVLWFDTTGAPKVCANGGSECGITMPTSGCVDNTFQIVLTSSDLDSGTKARELELMSGGLIQAVKPGDKGLASSVWALNPGVTSGPGECE